MDAQNLKKFKKVVDLYKDDIVNKWIDFFVYNKEIKSIIRHNGDSNAKILWETDETTTEPIISKI